MNFKNDFEKNADSPFFMMEGQPFLDDNNDYIKLAFYSINICLQGKASLIIEGKKVNLSKNSLLVCMPTALVLHKNSTKNFLIRSIFFEKNFLLKNIADPFLVERIAYFKTQPFLLLHLTSKQLKKITYLLEQIEEKIQHDFYLREDAIRTYIFLILIELSFLFAETQNSIIDTKKNTSKSLYFDFVEIVRLNIYDHKDVQFYLNELHVTNKNLIQILKSASNKTPSQIIHEILLKEAVVLMNNPSLTLTEIAYKLNFQNIGSFSRFFKKMTCKSPSAFRNQ